MDRGKAVSRCDWIFHVLWLTWSAVFAMPAASGDRFAHRRYRSIARSTSFGGSRVNFPSRVLPAFLLALALLSAASADAQVAPVPTGAISRKVHGAAGIFDLPLSLT